MSEFTKLSPKGSRLRSALLSTVALSSNFGPSSNFHFGDPVDDMMPLSVCHQCEDGCNSAGIRDLCNSISDYHAKDVTIEVLTKVFRTIMCTFK